MMMNGPRPIRSAARALCLLSLLAFGGDVGFGPAAARALEVPGGQAFPVYRLGPADNADAVARMAKEDAYRLDQLRSWDGGKADDAFVARARMVFKGRKSEVLVASRAFGLPPSGEAASPDDGWRRQGSTLIWQGKSVSASPQALALVREGGEPVRVGDIDVFHVEYTASPSTPLCVPQLEFSFAIQPVGPRAGQPWVVQAHTGPPTGLKVRSEMDAANETWKEKDLLYIGSRYLGLLPDTGWRYVQDGGMSVIQRRAREPLDGVEAIDILLAGGIALAQVNLIVGAEEGGGTGELLEFPASKQKITLPDGRPGVRLNVRAALEKRFPEKWAANSREPGKHRFFLKEIVIFIPGEARAYAAAKPVRRVAFLGRSAGKSPVQELVLPSAVTSINEYRQRLVANLGPVYDKGMATLNDVVLWLVPPVDATACAIRIERVRAGNTYNTTVPAFAASMDSWLQRFGGAARADIPEHAQTIQPGIVEYLPLSTLTNADSASDRLAEYALESQQKGQLVFRQILKQGEDSYRILGNDGRDLARGDSRLVSSAGATLSAIGRMPKASVDAEALVLEGSSRALTLAWPMKARIDASTWFFLGVTEGADQLGAVQLVGTLGDGRLIHRRVEPNRPVRLTTEEAELRGLRLDILPMEGSYRIKLRDIAIFSPVVASHAEVFALRLPTTYTVIPQPVLPDGQTGVLSAKPGRLAGLVGDVPLRFSTPLDPAVRWLRGLKLTYRVPLTYADNAGCSLTLRFNWDNARVERRLCLTKSKDSLFIPFASLAGAAENAKDLGMLRSIDWVLDVPGSRARDLAESFELTFEVEGVTTVSPADNLRLSPLFYAGDTPILTDASKFREPAPQHDISKGIWLALPDGALLEVLYEGVKQGQHWLFALAEISVEPRKTMPRDRWVRLTQGPIPPSALASKLAAYLGLLAGLALLAWAAWKWWRPVARQARAGAAVLGRWQRRGAQWVVPRIRRAWPRAQPAVAVLALGPGLWFAGRLGWDFPGLMVFLSVTLLAWSAYCHWRGRKVLDGFDRVGLRSSVVVVGVAAACAIWSLGRYRFGAEAMWGFLPLLAVGYAFLPAIYGSYGSLVSRYRRWVIFTAWAVVTTLIYRRGLVADFGTDKNLYIAAAVLTAAFAMHAGVVALEPRLRRLLPAMSDRIYGTAGGAHFAAAVVSLVATAIAIAMRQEVYAEQLAIVAYYGLIFGTAMEVVALRRSIRERRSAAEAAMPSPGAVR